MLKNPAYIDILPMATKFIRNRESGKFVQRKKAKRNKTKRNKTKRNKERDGSRLHVDAELGQLVAYLSTDPEHPGIYIDLKRGGSDCMAPVAMVEYTSDDCKTSMGNIPPSIVCRVWGDATKEDYTDLAICHNLDEYFEKEYSQNEHE